MKKILMSVAVIGFVGAIAAGATGAFFSDTEVSSGNKFTAGSLDLKIDNTCHYFQNGVDVGCVPTLADGTVNPAWTSNWEETDLRDGVHKFFNFGDIKPGDWGEDTISLHVYDNDAWGKMKMKLYNNVDNSCTEPENGVDGTCDNAVVMPGELLQSMKFATWLDQGKIPGFQCGSLNTPGTARCHADPWEGDNIWQERFENTTPDGNPGGVTVPGEPMIPTEMVAMDLQGNKLILPSGDPDFDRASFFDVFFDVDMAMRTAYDNGLCATLSSGPGDGHMNYGQCHGIAWDGRLVGSTTYYIGWKWMLPETVGNEVQSDSLMGDMVFNVVQHRNNPHGSTTGTITP